MSAWLPLLLALVAVAAAATTDSTPTPTSTFTSSTSTSTSSSSSSSSSSSDEQLVASHCNAQSSPSLCVDYFFNLPSNATSHSTNLSLACATWCDYAFAANAAGHGGQPVLYEWLSAVQHAFMLRYNDDDTTRHRRSSGMFAPPTDTELSTFLAKLAPAEPLLALPSINADFDVAEAAVKLTVHELIHAVQAFAHDDTPGGEAGFKMLTDMAKLPEGGYTAESSPKAGQVESLLKTARARISSFLSRVSSIIKGLKTTIQSTTRSEPTRQVEPHMIIVRGGERAYGQQEQQEQEQQEQEEINNEEASRRMADSFPPPRPPEIEPPMEFQAMDDLAHFAAVAGGEAVTRPAALVALNVAHKLLLVHTASKPVTPVKEFRQACAEFESQDPDTKAAAVSAQLHVAHAQHLSALQQQLAVVVSNQQLASGSSSSSSLPSSSSAPAWLIAVVCVLAVAVVGLVLAVVHTRQQRVGAMRLHQPHEHGYRLMEETQQ